MSELPDPEQLLRLFRAGRLEESLALSASLAAYDATRVLALNMRARCLLLLGRADEAASFVREHAQELEHSGDAWMTLVHADEVAGDERARLESLRRACELAPNADRLTLLGVALAEAGEQNAAEQALLRAMELDPSHSEAHANFAFHIVGGSDLARAEALYRRAVDLDPENRFAAEQLGLCMWCDPAQHEEAERVLRRAAQTGPLTAAGAVALGDILWRRGATSEAREQFLCAIEEPSTFVAVHAGEFFAAHGEFEVAERVYLRALQREQSAELLWQYGLMLRQAGQTALGDVLVRRAHKLAPEDVRISEDL